MGFFAPPEPRTLTMVVETGIGSVFWPGGQNSKARLWLMEGNVAIICVNAPDGGVNRISFEGVVSAVYVRSQQETTVLLGDGSQIVLDARGCGCSMGAVGSAGPVEGPYEIVRVRADWYTVQ